MRIPTSDDPAPERRRALSRLRQMEIIEGLLEFDLASLEQYADAVAEERQNLTKRFLPTGSGC
ncbi:hypothetical protein FS800_26715 [Agrobacterium vitis]|uniref:hypothetical protein n=1 Tax=Rhizobium/Agrobacterium group TaxID=227290 RepID=UPI0012E8736F|nr:MULTISPECIES: hypothetical protein [Rhizobium/Agrobacterium group]MCF1475385.1 hypothetical protein [Allorhizobium ampelinum]MCF1485680.1 hypothetical protein [Allorhizobium ampelinum]MVA74395.1 hypothetical protein [Agrobacterium vitis]NSZ20267.1 hypothetical protein [Agrobacterium vitis]QZO07283.1 hypothetical protein K4831_23935 [Agrobacterium vitis]